MSNSNDKKNKLLGEPFGTASAKLRKAILFKLLVETNQNICFQCKNKIDNIDDLSIEHKKPWMSAENPRKEFFNLDNVGFSHLKCNVNASNRNVPKPSNDGENCYLSKITEKEVLEILDLYHNKKISVIELSKHYNVNRRELTYIVAGQTWKETFKKFSKIG